MSVVANYILTIRNPDYEPDEGLREELERELERNCPECGWPRFFNARRAHYASNLGPKALEADVWIGASNGFGPDIFLAFFRQLPEDSRLRRLLKLYVQDDNEEEFRQLWPDPPDGAAAGELLAELEHRNAEQARELVRLQELLARR